MKYDFEIFNGHSFVQFLKSFWMSKKPPYQGFYAFDPASSNKVSTDFSWLSCLSTFTILVLAQLQYKLQTAEVGTARKTQIIHGGFVLRKSWTSLTKNFKLNFLLNSIWKKNNYARGNLEKLVDLPIT